MTRNELRVELKEELTLKESSTLWSSSAVSKSSFASCRQKKKLDLSASASRGRQTEVSKCSITWRLTGLHGHMYPNDAALTVKVL